VRKSAKSFILNVIIAFQHMEMCALFSTIVWENINVYINIYMLSKDGPKLPKTTNANVFRYPGISSVIVFQNVSEQVMGIKYM